MSEILRIEEITYNCPKCCKEILASSVEELIYLLAAHHDKKHREKKR